MLMCLLSIPVHAKSAPIRPVVLSAAPDKVAVTLYRDPDRDPASPIDADMPSAFALIAETRTVTLPPGEVVIRFEGVGSGIVPQSAILFGAPPRERNRDAALLSQKGLVDAFTGQRVTLRRTDPATGHTVEETATIRSAADRLIVTTPRGVEALYCSGLAQTLIYPGAPETLSAKPVLSMTTKDQPGGTVTITLAYIATGFDWDATYVGTLADDGRSLALLGWLTLASGDDTSFADATTSAVAGRVNRSDATRDDTGEQAKRDARWLNRASQCWPAGTTSDVRAQLPPPPPPAPIMMDMAASDIVVTGRAMMEKAAPAPPSVVAQAEGLGDLKLYRIPVPVTVAARSQKQVAFMVKDRIAGELIYRSTLAGDEPETPRVLFRFPNRKREGAGDPLPAGKAIFYQDSSAGRMFVGETSTMDKAVDEEVELAFADAANVTVDHEVEARDQRRGATTRHRVTIRNANPFPVRFELDVPVRLDTTITGLPGRLATKPGKRVWSASVPPGGSVALRYAVIEPAANER